MKRFCSQYIFHTPDEFLKQHVIEQNETGIITNIFPLNGLHAETSHTLFVDGIISNQIISLKETLPDYKLEQVKKSYNYIDFSPLFPINSMENKHKPLLLDFGISTVHQINDLLKKSVPFLYSYSALEIITAATYLPAMIAGENTKIETGSVSNLVLWKGFNLSTQKITDKIKIELLSSGYK